jgi:hypothetical protein
VVTRFIFAVRAKILVNMVGRPYEIEARVLI